MHATRRSPNIRRRQRGIIAVVVAIGAVALLAMVGLALDTGHLGLNKSRLQGSVDAAALAAAKVLDQTGSQAQATAAARGIFDLNAANHPELQGVVRGADLGIAYSNTLNPFVAGSAPPNYVRVVANNFTMWAGFSRLLGMGNLSTAASAVAGPSAPIGPGEACDLAPMMVCGDLAAGAAGNWGYDGSDVTLLKVAAGSGAAVGPGNYQLIQLGGPGANLVRENLAGGYEACVDPGNTVTTKPGNNVGPTAQGLNTRFGEYQGGGMNSGDYPPDRVTTQPAPNLWSDGTRVFVGGNGNPNNPRNGTLITDVNQISYNYSNYTADMSAGNYTNPNGVPRRRVLAVPIVNCSTMVNGQGTLPILGFGCFFLLRTAVQQGVSNYVYGQYIGQCAAAGSPGPVPGPVAGPGIYKIVLHNDPSSGDS